MSEKERSGRERRSEAFIAGQRDGICSCRNFFIAGEFLSRGCEPGPHRDSKASSRRTTWGGTCGVGRLKLGCSERLRGCSRNHTTSLNRLSRSCEWQQVPGSGGELLRFRFALREGEESSESCLLLLLMGIDRAKPFKEKSFMLAPFFSLGPATVLWCRRGLSRHS